MIRSLLLLPFATTALLAASPAHAQYYRDEPPPLPRYRYDEGPPPGAYYERRERFGYRCDATAATPGGGRSIVCPLRRPRPVDARCECPPPPPPPGYSYGPPLPGRVIP